MGADPCSCACPPQVIVFGTEQAMQQEMQWSAEVAELQRRVYPSLAEPSANEAR
jgi:hypothetical protein